MLDKTCDNCYEKINTSKRKVYKPKGFFGFLKKEAFCTNFCRDQFYEKNKRK